MNLVIGIEVNIFCFTVLFNLIELSMNLGEN
jgi:hypothetical protein